jgi:hypothetical protein
VNEAIAALSALRDAGEGTEDSAKSHSDVSNPEEGLSQLFKDSDEFHSLKSLMDEMKASLKI